MDKKISKILSVYVNQAPRIALFLIFISSNSCDYLRSKSGSKTIPIRNLDIKSFNGFKHVEIGIENSEGGAKFENTRLEIDVMSDDIWNKNDSFHYAYKKLTGDFDFSTRISKFTNTSLYSKAGIMARKSLDVDSENVFFMAFGSNSSRNNNNGGFEFQFRRKKGVTMEVIYPNISQKGKEFNVNFPNTWIKLKRVGKEFKAYISHDNKMWIKYTEFTMKFPDEIFVGFAVTSNNLEKKISVTFESPEIIN